MLSVTEPWREGMPCPARSALGLFAGLVLLAGCDGSSDGPGNPPPEPPPPDVPAIALEAAFPSLVFDSPVLLQQAPGAAGRWFIVEQPGVVRVFDNAPATADAEVFVDIEDRVNDGFSEAGLLGMAFHPAFPTTPYVYLSYTATGPGGGSPLISRIARFTSADGGASLDPCSEVILLTALQHAGNHNGGHLAFGPDGLLYGAFGDGGGAGDPAENGQNPTNLLGSIIRIDINGGTPYAIAPDNPFAANLACPTGASAAASGCPEIFAWGLRNPWRFSFDRATGTLWAGDVGQDSWEEVNRIVAGGNYGWDEREGAHCYEPPSGCATDTVDPVAEYGLAGAQSITGGYVYRGNAIPALQAHYVFADFIAGIIFAIPVDSQPTVSPRELLDSSFRFSTFAEALDGELYVVDYSGGTLHRIVAAP
jgi:glucose/arabinose dehydrogenase